MPRDAATWYVLNGHAQSGPLTRVELGVELATGAIATDSLVWKEGMIDWLPGAKVPELESLFKNPPRSPRASAPPAGRREKGMGLTDFDTAQFRLADLQPADDATRREMEFDTGHFRLQDLKGMHGVRAAVPKRIAPRGQDSTPVAPVVGRSAKSAIQPASIAATPRPPASHPVPHPTEPGWVPTAIAIAVALALCVSLVWYLIAD